MTHYSPLGLDTTREVASQRKSHETDERSRFRKAKKSCARHPIMARTAEELISTPQEEKEHLCRNY